MAATSLQQAAEALRQHYGIQPLPGEAGSWSTLAKLIVGRGLSSEKLELCWAKLAESPFRSAAETAASSLAEIEETLEAAGRSSPAPKLLKSLADWWCNQVDADSDSIDPGEVFRSSQLDSLRQELQKISGLGIEQADRILLFVLALPVYPLDRSSIRVSCRHGWLGIESEYDEWQTFFVSGLREADVSLEQYSLWSARVGKDFCGPKPDCEHCPLKHLLPSGGPYETDG